MMKINWKKIWKGIVSFFVSIVYGDFLIRFKVDRLFPYIIYMFVLGCLSISISYVIEQRMSKAVTAQEWSRLMIETYSKKCFHLATECGISNVQDRLQEENSQVMPPQVPAGRLE